MPDTSPSSCFSPVLLNNLKNNDKKSLLTLVLLQEAVDSKFNFSSAALCCFAFLNVSIFLKMISFFILGKST